MEYRILTSESYIDLETTINAKISDGWILQGGISVTLSESDEFRYVIYAQAVTKEKP